VVSFETEQLTGRAVVLGATRVDWSAAKIIGLYWHRWPTATFDQDRTGPLGFNEYRMRSAEASGKHWWLHWGPVGHKGARCCSSRWC
jgi:hypothetical protein